MKRTATHKWRIAIVTSQFNEDVTQGLYEGALVGFASYSDQTQLDSYWVPGAVELPLTAQRLALTGRYDAILCLGAVIRGETDHYDYVCQQVSYGCQKVALDYNLPVIFGVLTAQTDELAMARASADGNNKGTACAKATITFLETLIQIDDLP